MKTLFNRFIKDESGATAIEYGLIAALVAVAIITPSVPSAAERRAGVTAVDPAQQGVLAYVQAHSVVDAVAPRLAALDPAQQGVLSYIERHRRQPTAAHLDPAQQSVLRYVEAHTAARDGGTRAAPVDPRAQSVLDYLRAHRH